MERDEAPACGAAPVHRPGVDGTRDLQPQRAQERSRHEAEDKAFGRAVPQQARRRPDVFVLRPYGVTLDVGRGYDGWSSIRAAAERLDDDDVILYFGDFDPSGEDMVRSLRERLADQDSEPTIIKCALVFEDIERYGLPPDFAKATDTRAAAFVARYGPRSSVEARRPARRRTDRTAPDGGRGTSRPRCPDDQPGTRRARPAPAGGVA